LSAALVMSFVPATDKFLIILAAAIFGAGAFPLYALAVAHANDNAASSEYVEISSGLLFIYGIGAAAGPLFASLSRQIFSTPTLFLFTAAVHGVLIGWVLWRVQMRKAPPSEERVVFADAAI